MVMVTMIKAQRMKERIYCFDTIRFIRRELLSHIHHIPTGIFVLSMLIETTINGRRESGRARLSHHVF
jgi:hypothetical protein